MKSSKQLLLIVSLVTFLFSCKKKFDDYYAPPDNLEPPIYEQLKSRGKFTKFLALIARARTFAFWLEFSPKPNKALEPTSTSVTLRAVVPLPK